MQQYSNFLTQFQLIMIKMNVITEEYSLLSSSALTSISDPFQQVFHNGENIREFLSMDELP